MVFEAATDLANFYKLSPLLDTSKRCNVYVVLLYIEPAAKVNFQTSFNVV